VHRGAKPFCVGHKEPNPSGTFNKFKNYDKSLPAMNFNGWRYDVVAAIPIKFIFTLTSMAAMRYDRLLCSVLSPSTFLSFCFVEGTLSKERSPGLKPDLKTACFND